MTLPGWWGLLLLHVRRCRGWAGGHGGVQQLRARSRTQVFTNALYAGEVMAETLEALAKQTKEAVQARCRRTLDVSLPAVRAWGCSGCGVMRARCARCRAPLAGRTAKKRVLTPLALRRPTRASDRGRRRRDVAR